ncbi:MAG: extracellular solute-binding protein [Candidatus Doudnabacteria bacterium]|nr:extracellular solute-binding protein [Candidatus Doudnabacteria bacterium]
MNKKYLIIGGAIAVLLIVLLAVVFGGGGSNKPSEQKEIEIVWWKTFEESENVNPLIEAYQESHQNIKITFVKKDIADYEQELVDAIASGRTPDIFTIHNDWLPKHIDKLAPAPDSLITSRAYKETFIDAASADFIKDGKIYAFPLSVDVLTLYYNKDLLNSAGVLPPKTWPELVAAVEKITRQAKPGTFNVSAVALGTSANVNRAVDILLLLMLQNGTQFYSDNGSSAVFDNEVNLPNRETFNPGATALEFYTQFADPGKKVYTWNSKSDFSLDAFTSGKVAMIFSYAYLMPTLRARAPNLNWAVAPIPQIDQSGLKVNFANYWGEAVSKFSGDQAVAWDFLKFISEKENLKKYYEKKKLPSSRKDILTEQAADEEIGVFAEEALSARTVYKKDVAKFESIFLKMIDDVVLRNLSVEDAIRNAAASVNLLIKN